MDFQEHLATTVKTLGAQPIHTAVELIETLQDGGRWETSFINSGLFDFSRHSQRALDYVNTRKQKQLTLTLMVLLGQLRSAPRIQHVGMAPVPVVGRVAQGAVCGPNRGGVPVLPPLKQTPVQ